MRLWHIDLIRVLPKQQLLGQWRELNSIFKNKNRHILINFVYDSPNAELLSYSVKVVTEMRRRGYKCNVEAMTAYFSVADYEQAAPIKIIVPFAEKMNDEYLAQCYFNLQEKYRCGGITDEEWAKIDRVARERVKSWVSNNL